MFIDCYGKGGIPLGKEIKVLTPDDLWRLLTAIPDCFENVVCRDTDILQIDATFVDRTVHELQTDTHNYEPALDFIQRWLASHQDTGRRGLAIVGERGAGKTWLLKHFQKVQMNRHIDSPWLCPAVIFVGMRDYAIYLRRI